MESTYNELKKLKSELSVSYLPDSSLATIFNNYQRIIQFIDNKKTISTYGYKSEISDLSDNLSELQYGKTEKIKREARSTFINNLKSDIEALVMEIKYRFIEVN